MWYRIQDRTQRIRGCLSSLPSAKWKYLEYTRFNRNLNPTRNMKNWVIKMTTRLFVASQSYIFATAYLGLPLLCVYRETFSQPLQHQMRQSTYGERVSIHRAACTISSWNIAMHLSIGDSKATTERWPLISQQTEGRGMGNICKGYPDHWPSIPIMNRPWSWSLSTISS